MAETRLSNVHETVKKRKRPRKSFVTGYNFLHLLRFAFFVFLSFVLVYLYYLHSQDMLQKTILEFWTDHKKAILSLSIVIVYSTVIFIFGVWKGRRKR